MKGNAFPHCITNLNKATKSRLVVRDLSSTHEVIGSNLITSAREEKKMETKRKEISSNKAVNNA